MKIGILSMQRVANYGSFWQAYLLKQMLSDKADTVEFIDIIPGITLYEEPKRKFRINKLRKIPNKIFFQPHKERMFKMLQISCLGCDVAPNYSSSYDCIIIGSDEVFNFAQSSPWGFSKQLHGGIENCNVNSYAASFGTSTYEDAEKYNICDELTAASSNLINISVRDENSYSIIKKMLPEKEIYRHLDPVLVGELPIPLRGEVKQKYVLIYAYSFRFNDKDYIKEIKEFAKRKGCKIYSIGFYQTWVDKNILVDPYELLQYFVNAEYVITDTFHGTIFSVRCHKKFAVVIRESNRKKLSSLLADLNLQDQEWSNPIQLEEIITASVPYATVDTILERERERTQKYLRKCLSGAACV